MSHVRLEQLSKIYSNARGPSAAVVDGIDLEIRDSEFMVLVGPSGCGKSTTLRMIAGLEDISGGAIHIDGVRVNDLPPKDRDIAMVFQNYALYPHLTVYDNLAFGLRLRHFAKPEIDSRVREAAELLELTEYLERKPRALSGGQRQRVAVGRAIVRKPKVFLFDEPLSNLDAKMRASMRAEIKRLHRHLGATMIYVTHDQVEAMTMGDRICVMHEGRVQQVARPLELYHEPVNRFVAGFIGSPPMNFVRGTLQGEHDRLVFVESNPTERRLRLTLDSRLARAGHSHRDREVLLGLRPEHIQELRSLQPEVEEGYVATIEIVESLGSETFLHFDTGTHRLIARVSPEAHQLPGRDVLLSFDLTRASLFDAQTGRRLAPDS